MWLIHRKREQIQDLQQVPRGLSTNTVRLTHHNITGIIMKTTFNYHNTDWIVADLTQTGFLALILAKPKSSLVVATTRTGTIRHRNRCIAMIRMNKK